MWVVCWQLCAVRLQEVGYHLWGTMSRSTEQAPAYYVVHKAWPQHPHLTLHHPQKALQEAALPSIALNKHLSVCWFPTRLLRAEENTQENTQHPTSSMALL
jgi:hypothetical protein